MCIKVMRSVRKAKGLTWMPSIAGSILGRVYVDSRSGEHVYGRLIIRKVESVSFSLGSGAETGAEVRIMEGRVPSK